MAHLCVLHENSYKAFSFESYYASRKYVHTRSLLNLNLMVSQANLGSLAISGSYNITADLEVIVLSSIYIDLPNDVFQTSTMQTFTRPTLTWWFEIRLQIRHIEGCV